MYYLPFIFLLVLLLAVIMFDLAARYHYKKTGHSSDYFIEVMRKGAHTTGGMLFAFAPTFGITTISQYLILVLGLLVLTLNEQKLFMFKKMRPGAVKYTWAFSFVTIPLIYYEYFVIFKISCLIYAIPDSLAALVGRAFGKPIKIIGNKSIIGFLAYTLSAAIIFNFTNLNIITSIGLALLIATVELYAKKGSDNFLCPTLAAICLYILGVR